MVTTGFRGAFKDHFRACTAIPTLTSHLRNNIHSLSTTLPMFFSTYSGSLKRLIVLNIIITWNRSTIIPDRLFVSYFSFLFRFEAPFQSIYQKHTLLGIKKVVERLAFTPK